MNVSELRHLEAEADLDHPGGVILSHNEYRLHVAMRNALPELLKALEPFANVAELIEVDTEGFSETDIFDLTFNDYLFERFTLAQFQAARRALGGKKDG